MPVPEDPMEEREHGRRAAAGGWFVLNLADSNGMGNDRIGTYSAFESPEARQPHFGIGVHILWPGQPNGLYHEEDNQEDFLVLSGECSCSSRRRSGGCASGTSSTARRTRATSSSAPATGRARS